MTEQTQRYDMTITVNKADGEEREISAVGQFRFSDIGGQVGFSLMANGITDWSSLVIVVVRPDALPSRPALRVVS